MLVKANRTSLRNLPFSTVSNMRMFQDLEYSPLISFLTVGADTGQSFYEVSFIE